MKTKKTVTETKEVTDKTFCDLCKKQIKDGWDCFSVAGAEVKIRRTWTYVSATEGIHYPEGGGDAETIEYDVCVKCFKEKLIPFMESQGAEPTRREWD